MKGRDLIVLRPSWPSFERQKLLHTSLERGTFSRFVSIGFLQQT
jgi:hypothetical protein